MVAGICPTAIARRIDLGSDRRIDAVSATVAKMRPSSSLRFMALR